MNQSQNKILVLNDLYVSQPSEQCVESRVFNLEIGIEPIKNWALQLLHNILSHQQVSLSIFVSGLLCLLTHLNPGGVVRCEAILK